MAFARLQEWTEAVPGTEMYDAVIAKMDVHANPPPGLMVHTAGSDPDGVWRIFGVWDTREHADRFEGERLMPAIQEVTRGAGADPVPPTRIASYELHDMLLP